MQKFKFLSIFLSLLAATLSHAQISYNCTTSAIAATPTSGLSGCLGHDFSQEEIDALPTMTVQLNIHFIGHPVFGNFYPGAANDWGATNGNKYTELMIAHANQRWADLKPSPTSLQDFLGDSKVRFEVYSEPSNTSDIHGGIWYYANRADFDAVSNNLPYGTKVIHVLIEAISTPSNPQWGGATDGIGIAGRVYLNDAFYNATHPDRGWWSYARILMHEVGHIGNLPHVYYCGNICNGVDVDADIECNLPSGCTNDPGGPACFGWESGGTNMMSNNVEQWSLSPCQWQKMINYFYTSNYNCIRFCSPTIKPYIIKSGTHEVWDKLKIMNRNVIIEPLASLTINCEARFGEQCMVHVNRGARLTMNSGGKMTWLCKEQKWRGIVVYGNNNIAHNQISATGTLVADNPGIVLLNGGEISYAITGVSCNPPVSWPDLTQNWNGLIQANGTRFLNNNRGAEFMLDSKTMLNSNGSFSVLLPVHNNRSSFTNCTFTNNHGGTSNSRGVSIWAANGIVFDKCTFKSLAQYGIQTGDAAITVKGSTFENNDFGVHATTTSDLLFSPILIGGSSANKNTFRSNNFGVYASTITNLEVSFNDFSGDSQVGVYALGAGAYNVYTNNFTNCKSGLVNKQTAGSEKRSYCNVYKGNQIGIVNQGNNKGYYFENEEFTTSTPFNVYVTDIVDLAQNMTEQAVMNDQGAIGNAVFNKFSSPEYANAIRTNGDVQEFTYYYPTPGTLYTRAEPGCTLNDPCTSIINDYNKRETSGNDLGCLVFLHEPPHEDDRIRVVEVHGKIKEIMALTSNNLDASLLSERDALEREKVQIISRLTWADVQNSNYAGLEELYTAVEDYRQLVGLKMFQYQLEQAANILEKMPIVQEADQQFKNVQAINLRRLRSVGLFELTDEDYNTLQTISNAHTNASPYAQGLLLLLKGELMRPTIPTPEGESERSSQETVLSTEVLVITPNPVGDVLRVTLPNAWHDTPLSLQIMDGTGRIILSRDVASSIEIVQPVSTLSEGLYFLTIRNKDGILGTAKFVHQR
jgi:hypothetical protein